MQLHVQLHALISVTAFASAAILTYLYLRYGAPEFAFLGVFLTFLGLTETIAYVVEFTAGITDLQVLRGICALRGAEWVWFGWVYGNNPLYVLIAILLENLMAVISVIAAFKLFGLGRKAMRYVVYVLLTLSAVTVALSAYSMTLLNPIITHSASDINLGYLLRDLSNLLRLLAMLTALTILTLSFFRAWRVTRGRADLILALSWGLLLVSWVMTSITRLNWWTGFVDYMIINNPKYVLNVITAYMLVLNTFKVVGIAGIMSGTILIVLGR